MSSKNEQDAVESGSDAGDEQNDAVADEKVEDVRNPDVVTKYQEAAVIAQGALAAVVAALKDGALALDLCVLGDAFIQDATSKIYNKGAAKITKGVGFPTCVSINNSVGSFSPFAGDATVVRTGDVVKIDCGVHIDGYISQVAHTVVVGGGPVTGRKADVIAAVFTGAECAVRLLKPGSKTVDITNVLDLVAKQYNVRTVEGILSHQSKRFQIDGDKTIANNIPDVPLTGENKIKEDELVPNEVWTLDIVMSTGAGKPSRVDDTTTVFARKPDANYALKMKASRAVFSEIIAKFPVFPFSLRHLESEPTKAKLGIREAQQHGLVEPFPVLKEKEGEFVAHVKFTVLLMPSGSLRVTGGSWDQSQIQSEHKVTDAKVLEVLALPLPTKKKSKNKKKKKAAAAAAAPAAAAAAAPAK